ncbi:hypothetical protein [Metabacillus endolithicus]
MASKSAKEMLGDIRSKHFLYQNKHPIKRFSYLQELPGNKLLK